MTESDTNEWTADVVKRTEPTKKDVLKLEFRGVTFAFDSVVVTTDEFRFAKSNRIYARIDADDVPDDLYGWLGENTDGFGNADAVEPELI